MNFVNNIIKTTGLVLLVSTPASAMEESQVLGVPTNNPYTREQPKPEEEKETPQVVYAAILPEGISRKQYVPEVKQL